MEPMDDSCSVKRPDCLTVLEENKRYHIGSRRWWDCTMSRLLSGKVSVSYSVSLHNNASISHQFPSIVNDSKWLRYSYFLQDTQRALTQQMHSAVDC